MLKDEEVHAGDIAGLLSTLDPKPGKAVAQFTGDSATKRFTGA